MRLLKSAIMLAFLLEFGLAQTWELSLASGTTLTDITVENLEGDTLYVLTQGEVDSRHHAVALADIVQVDEHKLQPVGRRIGTSALGFLVGLGSGVGSMIAYVMLTDGGLSGTASYIIMLGTSISGAIIANQRYSTHATAHYTLREMSTEEKRIVIQSLLDRRI